MDQNIDFSGSDQIQTPQYPIVDPPSQEISDDVFHAKGDLMKSIQTFLEEFNYIPFKEKPKILLQAWDRSNFLNDNEDHYVQNPSNEIATSNSNQEKEGPPQDSDIRQFIREECGIEVCEEQKQKMEDTTLELVEIFRQKELLCMHDNVDDLIESALNSKLLSINSQRLNKEKQEVKNVVEQLAERRTRIEKSLQNFRVIRKSSISLKNTSQISPVHAVAPILSTKEPEYSSSMGYENSNTSPKTKSNEIIKSGVEELVPILSENEVTLEDKKEYIKYVEASLFDPEIVSVAEENELLSMNRLIANIESLNDNPTLDLVLNSSVSFPISEESDNSLSDNFSPEFETFCDHTEETRSGNTATHANDSLPERGHSFLEALLSDDSIPFPNNESSESDNPSVPRPPSEQPDADFEPDSGDEISVVMNNNDKLECLNPRDEFDDDDYFYVMFVIYSKMFLFFSPLRVKILSLTQASPFIIFIRLSRVYLIGVELSRNLILTVVT
uniref:Reverse transcriptase domain-containing protein n=1 Tax=Tanacetum cinerariifolium TaxID=118510 RepID=A0A699HQ24_TANCI|nr:hypothetical protein [Tanacetum cinerariifolium]